MSPGTLRGDVFGRLRAALCGGPFSKTHPAGIRGMGIWCCFCDSLWFHENMAPVAIENMIIYMAQLPLLRWFVACFLGWWFGVLYVYQRVPCNSLQASLSSPASNVPLSPTASADVPVAAVSPKNLCFTGCRRQGPLGRGKPQPEALLTFVPWSRILSDAGPWFQSQSRWPLWADGRWWKVARYGKILTETDLTTETENDQRNVFLWDVFCNSAIRQFDLQNLRT